MVVEAPWRWPDELSAVSHSFQVMQLLTFLSFFSLYWGSWALVVLFESCLSADFLLAFPIFEEDEASGKPVAAAAGRIASRAFPDLGLLSFLKDDFRGPLVCIVSRGEKTDCRQTNHDSSTWMIPRFANPHFLPQSTIAVSRDSIFSQKHDEERDSRHTSANSELVGVLNTRIHALLDPILPSLSHEDGHRRKRQKIKEESDRSLEEFKEPVCG